jgi:hypothetical protein
MIAHEVWRAVLFDDFKRGFGQPDPDLLVGPDGI